MRRSGKAIASLVLGIASIFMSFFGIATAVLAIVFGALGLRETSRQPFVKGRAMAGWGLGLGIAYLVIFGAIVGAIIRSDAWDDEETSIVFEAQGDGRLAVVDASGPSIHWRDLDVYPIFCGTPDAAQRVEVGQEISCGSSYHGNVRVEDPWNGRTYYDGPI